MRWQHISSVLDIVDQIQGGTSNSAAFIIATLELVPPKLADTGSATCHIRRRHRPLLMRLSSIGDGTSLKDPNMIPEKIAKATRTRLTIAQKIEVGHLPQVGNANSTALRHFKISERTIRNIKRSLPSLQQIVTNTATTLGTKTSHPAHYPTLEAHLLMMLAIQYIMVESYRISLPVML